jgi:predicted enzyme related to lactoylglutathione lyase
MFGWTFRRIADTGVDRNDATGTPGAASPQATPLRIPQSTPQSRQYALALLDDRPVAGIFQRAPRPGAHSQPAWLNFLAVRDVDVAVSAAVTDGARLIAPARAYPRRGRQAVLADPQGAVFGVMEATGGDPPDFLAEPGEWIWNSLIVRDPDGDAAFYQSIFGYEAFELTREDGLEHVVLSSQDSARASINALPPELADGVDRTRHGHWLAFVRVADAGAATARAVALGGQVVVPAHPDRHGGQVAIVTDPAGAVLGLMEWSVEPLPGQVP